MISKCITTVYTDAEGFDTTPEGTPSSTTYVPGDYCILDLATGATTISRNVTDPTISEFANKIDLTTQLQWERAARAVTRSDFFFSEDPWTSTTAGGNTRLTCLPVGENNVIET